MIALRKTTRVTTLWLTGLLSVLVLACLFVAPARSATDEFADEVKLGKAAADQVAKESKFITDPVLVARVQVIGSAIAAVATTREIPAHFGNSKVAKFNYTFKIVDDKAINAFSIPGGYVFINKGLIDYCQSDDELAAVMAHECSHIAHHHIMKLMKDQQKQMFPLMAAILAGALVHSDSGDIGALAYVAGMISTARMSDLGKDAEFDADRTGVNFLSYTKYNPVGMLTFMERMVRDEGRKPDMALGIYADHPQSILRAQAIIAEIQRLGLPINRRLITKYMRVEVRPVKDSTASAVWVGDTEVVRMADSGGQTAAKRASALAGRLSEQLFNGATMSQVHLDSTINSITMGGEELYTPAPEDAKLAGMSQADLAKSVMKSLQTAFFKELLQQG
jgi:Zn-dependent protease with chaperone function